MKGDISCSTILDKSRLFIVEHSTFYMFLCAGAYVLQLFSVFFCFNCLVLPICFLVYDFYA